MLRQIALRSVATVSRGARLPLRTFSYPVYNRWGFRSYSGESGLTQSEVEKRITAVLKSFDKIEDSSKITPTAVFDKDLGLDSLDTVEVLVAIEEEFNIEIPDNQSDEIKSIDQAVQYILAQPEGEYEFDY